MPTMKQVQCIVCGKEYEITLQRYNQKIKENTAFYCSSECRSHKGSFLCKCANCGKEILKTKSQIERSKSGNVFCSSSCSTSFNNHFKTGENHPRYTGNNYRKKAFDVYEHKCAVCGWSEDEDILEVHHKNDRHEDNDIENLVILCPTCHKYLTLHKKKLTQDFHLEPI